MGFEFCKNKVYKFCKIEVVADANGIPPGEGAAEPSIAEQALIGRVLDSIPVLIDLPRAFRLSLTMHTMATPSETKWRPPGSRSSVRTAAIA